MHKLTDFEPQMKVVYVPSHLGAKMHDFLNEDLPIITLSKTRSISSSPIENVRVLLDSIKVIHSDLQLGIVSSTNSSCVFVKFYPMLKNFGWDGTTSQGCRPEDLVIVI